MNRQVPYLPNEIIFKILEECPTTTCGRGLTTTMPAVVRCSKRFYEIATPLLYHSIETADYRSTLIPYSRLKSLALVVLSRPDIAAHVRHLKVRPWRRMYNYEEMDLDDDPNVEIPEVIQRAITSLSSNDEMRRAWLNEADSEDSYFALILSALPNLVSFHLTQDSYRRYTVHVLQLSRTDVRFSSVLTKLKSVFWGDNGNYMENLGQAITPTIFALPAINEIRLNSMDRLSNGNMDIRINQISPHTSTCTILELGNCLLSPLECYKLLMIPKALTTFIYNFGYRDGEISPTFAKIREGLDAHKETLESLHLHFSNYERMIFVFSDAIPMEPLDSFIHLKILKIDPIYILGTVLRFQHDDLDLAQRIVRFIPRSIEQLWFHHDEEFDGVISYALENILLTRKTQFPALCQVSRNIHSECPEQVEFGHYILKFDVEFHKKLRSMAREVGVEYSAFPCRMNFYKFDGGGLW
ncbi:hypothetical protein BS50DRAFT_582160 [Corynespora cassiicola Philippines]|uniref:Uncharacterized protein n=1 Tax=Corynespora cassiicola Philippines TaxID=1448308 RepID=A0A2T2PD59_CORCC|nr:hypothetical protein BS50DRAFT_582160 [Corynespora cassiicola Philippines]